MANPFLNKSDLLERDVETAIMLEQATVFDIGNAVAYTDGNKVFINTDDNLNNILPAYDHRMLKWLLWHERMHMELKHHNRFFKYVEEFEKEMRTPAEAFSDGAIERHAKKFNISKEEVNIIMDILVHDWMVKKFPDLVEVAMNNLAQMRNRNSLSYTFKTFTLEEMLNEYKAHKKGDDKKEGAGTEDKDAEETKEGDGEGKGKPKESKDKDESKEEEDKPSEGKKAPTKKKKGHTEGGKSEDKPTPGKDKSKDGEPEVKDEPCERPASGDEPLPDEHDKTDWSKLDKIDSKEFITEEESDDINRAVARLKKKKFKLARLTETLNGLVTSTRRRTYAKPCPIKVSGGAVLKGSTPGRTQLYLCFDASGSMGSEMEMFKEIISKSIPQAMDTPCEWFAGRNYDSEIKPYKIEHGDGYYKAKFKNFMNIYAHNGYDDDGDRTIELCWQAEQLGYSPIGITDGGGTISWSKDKLKQLKRTVFVGQNDVWLAKVKEINPRIQTLEI